MALCILTTLGSATAFAASKNESAFTAQYATVAPIIDGEIDEIWDTTVAITASFDSVPQFAYGYAKVLWTEDKLYLMADIHDSTVDVSDRNTANQACFWVSETASDHTEYFAPEDSNFSINQAGVYGYYSGINLGEIATYAARITDYGYVVEIVVPVQKPSYSYYPGAKIGFCLSVEDDANSDDDRDNVCASQTENYWSYPASLRQLTLLGDNIPSNDSMGNTDPAPNDNNIVQIVIYAVAAILIVCLLALVLFKKKA